jgi:hypothetical protein
MMKSEGAPQIGFDRFIQLDWARAALRVRAGFSDPEDLAQLIDETHCFQRPLDCSSSNRHRSTSHASSTMRLLALSTRTANRASWLRL